MVTGDVTCCTLDSSIRMDLTMWQSFLSSCSWRYWQLRTRSIHSSIILIVLLFCVFLFVCCLFDFRCRILSQPFGLTVLVTPVNCLSDKCMSENEEDGKKWKILGTCGTNSKKKTQKTTQNERTQHDVWIVATTSEWALPSTPSILLEQQEEHRQSNDDPTDENEQERSTLSHTNRTKRFIGPNAHGWRQQ